MKTKKLCRKNSVEDESLLDANMQVSRSIMKKKLEPNIPFIKLEHLFVEQRLSLFGYQLN
jgi:hypothetical protein